MNRGVDAGPLQRRRLTIRAATTPESASLSKSTLRKTSKVHFTVNVIPHNTLCADACLGIWGCNASVHVSQAKLESRLSKLGLETSGTKEVLIERLMTASQQTPVQASVPAEPQVSLSPQGLLL